MMHILTAISKVLHAIKIDLLINIDINHFLMRFSFNFENSYTPLGTQVQNVYLGVKRKPNCLHGYLV